MEIGTMSAEELALSFSTKDQTTPPPAEPAKVGDQFQRFQAAPPVGVKSSEELAADALKNPIVPTEGDEGKTPEQIAEVAKVQADLDSKKSAGRPKTKLDDSFKQGVDKLFKEQKLDPYTDGTEKGYLIPETWEDLVEVIDENKKNWVESSKAKDRDEVYNEILSTKSAAWQFLLENSNTYDNPAELIPLLTAVQNIEYGNSLDPSIEEDQVAIIRSTLSLQGLSNSDIESELADLKERGKQEARATALKPILDRYNESQANIIVEQKQAADVQKNTFWNGYYKNLEDNIFKAKDIDGVKLKNEHKQLIASALIPDENLGGLPIYTVIDNLVAAGNFRLLSKISLLSQDEKLYDSYFLTKKADLKVDGIQKVLRQSGTTSNPTEFDRDETVAPKPIKKSGYGYFG